MCAYLIFYKGDKVRACRTLAQARIVVRNLPGAVVRRLGHEVELPETQMLKMPFADWRHVKYVSVTE